MNSFAPIRHVREIRSLKADLLSGDRISPDHPLFGIIWINPERLHGEPCFYGTRVPVQALFDSLAAGETIADFLDGFEGVTQEQASLVIELAGNDLLAHIGQI